LKIQLFILTEIIYFMFREDIEKLERFIKLSEPIDFGDYACIGYFPYHVANISEKTFPKVPRKVFNDIENVLQKNHIADNKAVYVFIDKINFGTDDFLLQLKDCWGRLGKFEHLIGYNGEKLEVKKEHRHTFSKAMNQEYPRKCIHCNVRENEL